ncbi:MAG TPA: hypothetical protein VII35_14250 [Steroidobacteraceae bacterium]
MLLSGCGSSSYSSSRGTIDSTSGVVGTGGNNPPGDPINRGSGPTGSSDTVIATASVAGPMSVTVGAKQTLSITFTSSDGSAISGFGISGNLATLPAGWSGPGTLSCASVSAGSGCVLNLTYAPSAVGSGTLTINYVYVDNATVPNTDGSLTIAYAATAANNIVAAASPTGEVDDAVGAGSQSVTLGFTTDDGNAATNLMLTTDLAALPAGWSSSAASFSCAIVSAGSGCQLPLTYAPAASGRGMLTVNYSYTDNSGMPRSGALNIPYATSAANMVVATAGPAGEINAVEKTGAQPVAVTFTTDDGKAASGLYITSNLAALPAGWSSVSRSFSCGGVSTGNGCQLHLTYTPAALTSGTLILDYAYTDGAGVAQTGSLNLDYAATTNDNAIATAAPSGQIYTVAPGSVPVSVTFTTDDAREATALQLTSSLSALPAGWSSTATSFSCSGFSSGNGCQLPLLYAPTTAGSGTLILGYTYINNAGQSKSGSVNIAYRATTNDNVVGTAVPAMPAVSISGSGMPATAAVTVTFITDDGNPASGLAITSDLTALPAGWSSASASFACATVSAGTVCQLGLLYAPTMVANSTLSLNYSYNDNSGTAKAGSVSISYTATP